MKTMQPKPSLNSLRGVLGLAVALAVVLCTATTGCRRSDRSPIAPATGKVLFNGKPLQFGLVMFVPDHGRPAEGEIQSDGTFQLTTYQKNDGAVIGHHRVAITCEKSSKSGEVEESPGPSLIPPKYSEYKTSGLEATVKDKNEPFVFELTGKAP
ncbi:MAG: hypothetical protein ABFC77_16575 [Thermoguttaceae bacterium]